MMRRHAKFSDCGKYRLWLTRFWHDDLPIAMCIGLNPSTANAVDDDPTIRKLIAILTNLGFGGFFMCNLFTIISSNPDDIRSCPTPDFYCDKVIREIITDKNPTVIFCWGNFKQAEYRSVQVRKFIKEAKCFGKNFNGSPKHPLYLKSDVKLIDF